MIAQKLHGAFLNAKNSHANEHSSKVTYEIERFVVCDLNFVGCAKNSSKTKCFLLDAIPFKLNGTFLNLKGSYPSEY